jgi:hypothetical protein
MLGDPFQGYLDRAGYVDSGALRGGSRPSITTAQAILVSFFRQAQSQHGNNTTAPFD